MNVIAKSVFFSEVKYLITTKKITVLCWIVDVLWKGKLTCVLTFFLVKIDSRLHECIVLRAAFSI